MIVVEASPASPAAKATATEKAKAALDTKITEDELNEPLLQDATILFALSWFPPANTVIGGI